MTKKKWFAIGIIAVVVIGALTLIKVFPFWVTLVCLACGVAGYIAGYLFKESETSIINLVSPSEVLDSLKSWVSSITSNEASKIVAAARKAKAKHTATEA